MKNFKTTLLISSLIIFLACAISFLPKGNDMTKYEENMKKLENHNNKIRTEILNSIK